MCVAKMVSPTASQRTTCILHCYRFVSRPQLLIR